MIVPRRRALEHQLARLDERLRHSIIMVGGREQAEQEPWHHLGDPGEPGFQNGWENAAASAKIDNSGRTLTNPTPVGFTRSSHDWVHLKGCIARPAGWTFDSMFTLPVGYRPPTEFARELYIALAFVPDTGGAVQFGGAMLGIGSNGAVWGEEGDAVVTGASTIHWIGLDGLSFRIV